MFTLFYIEPPKFTRKPDGVSVVKPGQSKTFECQVTGTPEIDIYWFRDGNEISPSDKYKMIFDNNIVTLDICGADTKDSGIYYCEARNEAGSESCNMELKVKEPPSFVKQLSAADIVKGSNASLECQVIGTGPFEVMWHKDLKEIKSSTKHSFSQVQDILNLEIQKCDGVDVGEYQCTVSNEVGSCSCRTTLRIKG
ncbi:titin-like [Oncorhynchus keta]|uniref:titin-like n=1 Tax=Oncorhynchus keta TaxID=8018 RepID=UPI00227AC1D6|nr:titin-like [Oncorhynchus keta]